MPRTTFLYHAEAVGVSGHISLPVVDTVPLQASIASPLGEGSGKVRVENFKHLDYLRIDSIESHVVSSYSKKDDAYGTLASVEIEGLNNLHVVTCKRMVNRLTSKHKVASKHKAGSKHKNGTEAGSFILHGTHFDGLRIAGHEIKVDLAVGLLSELSTWKKLNDAWENDPKIRKELNALAMHPKGGDKLPLHNGVFACTLATVSDLPRGMERRDHGIYVPHFGTIYLAEYYISETTRRLRMLHVDLGCSVEGCNGYGDTGGGGTPMPGSS